MFLKCCGIAKFKRLSHEPMLEQHSALTQAAACNDTGFCLGQLGAW